ncbi:MAG: hypothetical protein KGS60_08265 [Verrucomicrobia bacterium]|nr:hypothetical protein [Verrucomicrobiota bacterium]
MGQQLFVDYHFHPNFRFGRREGRRAGRIWNAFTQHDLGVVVVSEHNWKRPRESFELLAGHRPPDARTVLLPGAEVLTREGLDIVVFGSDPAWYHDRHASGLLQPYRMSVEETVDFVSSRDGMAAFLPHPFTRGTTGAVDFYGEKLAATLAGRIGGVEVSNNCYDDCLKMVGRLCSRVLPETHRRMSLTQSITEEFLDLAGAGFFAHGSDAHFPGELGYGCLMDVTAPPLDPGHAFQLMTSHLGRESHARGCEKSAWLRAWHVSKSMLITLAEAMEKRSIRKNLRHSPTAAKLLEDLAPA